MRGLMGGRVVEDRVRVARRPPGSGGLYVSAGRKHSYLVGTAMHVTMTYHNTDKVNPS